MAAAFEAFLDSKLYEACVCDADSPEDFLNYAVFVILGVDFVAETFEGFGILPACAREFFPANTAADSAFKAQRGVVSIMGMLPNLSRLLLCIFASIS